MQRGPETLNPAQLEAVHHLGGPCLVLAGAGSGKTRVIVHKIARLLQAGHAPARIAAITFTNKAAQEMRERAKALVGARAAGELVVSTFHSLGVRILRADGERIGLAPRFSILDADDVLGVLKDAGATTDNALARRWQWTISRWKNAGLAVAQVEPADDDERVALRVMQRYAEQLAAYQAVDFDDLIGLPLKLLRADEAVRARWQRSLDHVLIDEVQDTNAVQYELFKLLVDPRAPRFTAVGDDDQSIYGWRGATIENLARLAQDYPALKVIALEQNYRSTGAILRAANAVIANNPKLYEKKLWSELGAGDPVALLACDGEEHEAERAVARVQALRAAGGALRYADFAILYRANHQARAFEQKLRAAQIPYKVSGGQSFFDRAEIRDLCAWLRLLVNTDDDPAFLRAVTSPKRGIGAQTLASLGAFAGRHKTSLFEALFAANLADALPRRAIDALHEFGRYVNEFEYRARHVRSADDAKALLLQWLADIGYERHLYDGEDSERLAAARWANVLDFADWVARRCGGEVDETGGRFATEAKSLLEVAQSIGVIASLAERGDERDVLTLSTLHAAKGLEWQHVVLAGVNEGLLPFVGRDAAAAAGQTPAPGARGAPAAADALTPAQLQEERRLMYVGITRARSTLAVSTLARRKRGRETIAGVPSRFIGEMKLDEAQHKVDPRERLKALRAASASRLEQAARDAKAGAG